MRSVAGRIEIAAGTADDTTFELLLKPHASMGRKRAYLPLQANHFPVEREGLAAAAELQTLLAKLANGTAADGIPGMIADCDRALVLYDRVGTSDPVDRSYVELQLGNGLLQLARGGDKLAPARAIAAYERGLALVSPESAPSEWLGLLYRLGSACAEFAKTDRSRVERAIETLERYVGNSDARNDASENARGSAFADLAYCYLRRGAGDRARNMERSSACAQLALQIFDPVRYRTQRAGVLMTLGSAQRNSVYGSRAKNVEAAIESHVAARDLWSAQTEPISWAQCAANLGNDFAERILGERSQNLEQSLIAFQHALEIFAAQGPLFDWAATMINLAQTGLERLLGGETENADVAIRAVGQVLDTLPVDGTSRLRARAVVLRADARMRRNVAADRSRDVEDAIADYEAALPAFAIDASPFFWAATRARLAVSYLEHSGGDLAANLSRAKAYATSALDVYTRDAYPFDWARTIASLARIQLATGADDLMAAAFDQYRSALDVFARAGMSADCLRIARELADAFAERGRFPESLDPYRRALNSAEDLYRSSLSRAGKEAELEASRGLANRAAYAFARSGDVAFAAVVLERNRARWINDVLERDRFKIERLRIDHPDLFRAYADTTAQLHNLEAVEAAQPVRDDRAPLAIDASWETSMKTASRDAENIMSEIATLPEFAQTFRFPTFDEIATAAIPGRPLVYLTAAPHGGLALVISRRADGRIFADPVALDGMTSDWLDSLARTWLAAPGMPRTQSDWLATIENVTERLWEPLARPLLERLECLGASRACVIPCGSLAFVPLHAACSARPAGRSYALDAVVLTYAPSARALVRAAATVATAAPRMLAVAEPLPVRAAALEHAEAEAEAVASTFTTPIVLRHEDATRAAVLAALPQIEIAHFSCHGFSDPTNPRRSGIIMANDEFVTIADLFSLDLERARLATLSACDTGTVGAGLPDEAISLAEGCVRAGFAGVVASQWPVADLATAMLMARFYERIADVDPTTERDLPTLLRAAQRWLRDTTNGEKAAYFASFLPELTTEPSALGRMSKASAGIFYRALAFDDPKERAYAHPYYWAAFSYVGV